MMSKRDKRTVSDACPCESGRLATDCCLPIVTGERQANTAESLMRSRYCAYVWQKEEHLRRTWAAERCPMNLQLNANQRWLGLKIVCVQAGEENDDTGTVEFVARFKVNGRGHRLHEISSFERRNDKWVYVEGTVSSK